MLTPSPCRLRRPTKGTIGKRADEFDPGEVPAMALLEYYLGEPDAERIFATQALAMSYAPKPAEQECRALRPWICCIGNEALHGENESAFMDLLVLESFELHETEIPIRLVHWGGYADHRTPTSAWCSRTFNVMPRKQRTMIIIRWMLWTRTRQRRSKRSGRPSGILRT